MIYALLVGINEYVSSEISNLEGCESDVKKVRSYLEKWAQNQSESIAVHQLLSLKASRKNIIQGFKEHLGQAESGDIALFYFSGHGSRRKSPPDFLDLPFQQDDFHENIVCADARVNGTYEIADKELNALLCQIKSNGAEVILILDCCHSGSGTRNGSLSIRKAAEVSDHRPIETFLPETLMHLKDRPDHLLLAACNPFEYAHEKNHHGNAYGVFTDALLDTLEQHKGQLNYQQLWYSTRNLLARKLPNVIQTPRFEAYGFFDAQRPFLKIRRASHESDIYSMIYHKGGPIYTDGGQPWLVKMGIIHGLTQDIPAARFKVYSDAQATELVGHAETIQTPDLFETVCRLEFFAGKRQMSTQSLFARPIYLSVEPLDVYVPSQKAIFDHLEIDPSTRESDFELNKDEFEWHINIAATKDQAKFQLDISKDSYRLGYPDSDQVILRGNLKGYTPKQAATEMGLLLRHLAFYNRISSLKHSPNFKNREKNSLIGSIYFPNENVRSNSEYITLDCKADQEIEFEIMASNNSRKEMFTNLIHLSRNYAVDMLHLYKHLPNDQEKHLLRDEDTLWIPIDTEPHLRQVHDHFKLVFSPKELPYLGLFQQENIQDLYTRIRDQISLQQRDRKQKKYPESWFTQEFHIKTLLELGRIGNKDLHIPCADKSIQIQAHSEFRAGVGLSSSAKHVHGPQSDRFITEVLFDSLYELVDFSLQVNKETILELHHIEGYENLDKNPLIIELQIPEAQNHEIIAISLPPKLPDSETSFEGFPILGKQLFLEKSVDNRFTLTLTTIPENPPDGRLDNCRSLKISFLRFEKDSGFNESHILQGNLFVYSE